MFVAEVRKPPHVAQTHSVAQAGQEEVTLVIPRTPLNLLLHCLDVLLTLTLALAHPHLEDARYTQSVEIRSPIWSVLPVRLLMTNWWVRPGPSQSWTQVVDASRELFLTRPGCSDKKLHLQFTWKPLITR